MEFSLTLVLTQFPPAPQEPPMRRRSREPWKRGEVFLPALIYRPPQLKSRLPFEVPTTRKPLCPSRRARGAPVFRPPLPDSPEGEERHFPLRSAPSSYGTAPPDLRERRRGEPRLPFSCPPGTGELPLPRLQTVFERVPGSSCRYWKKIGKFAPASPFRTGVRNGRTGSPSRIFWTS